MSASAWYYFPAVFFTALVLSLYVVPITRSAAIKWGLLDKPDGNLKNQTQPVAYLGGAAVFVAFIITLGLTMEWTHNIVAVLLGASVIVMVGLIDDFAVLKPGQKLMGQVLAALIIIKAGVHIEIELIPAWPIFNSVLGVGITLLWYLTMSNAVNLIDVMDGLSSTVALCASLVLAVLAVLNGSPDVAAIALVLAGGLLGFLRYNWRPASIYMGDTGTMFMGLMLAALAVMGKYTATNRISYLSPILIMGVPLFDTTLIMISRIRKGKSPFMGGPEHFALRLRRLGLPVPVIVLLSGAATLLLGTVAVISTFLPETIALIVFAAVILTGITALFTIMHYGDPERPRR